MNSRIQGLELKIPPLVVLLITALLMWLLARVTPQLIMLYSPRVAVALILASLGAAIIGAGVVEFIKSSTTVNPHAPETSARVVTTGIYRFTRNPMYAGMFLILLGWATYLANAAAATLPFVFAIYISRYQIHPEERILLARFGHEYEAYLGAVRRWV